MRNFVVVVFIFLFIIEDSVAQENKSDQQIEFDSIYFAAATTIAGTDVNRAIQLADTLYINAQTEVQKIRALMLTSTLYQQKGIMEEAIIVAFHAVEIAEKNNNFEWQARIFGFLSTNLRLLGLTSRGKVYLQKGIKAISKISGDSAYYSASVAQEQACYVLSSEDFDLQEAIRFLEQAKTNINKLSRQTDVKYFTAINEMLFGDAYFASGDFNTSIQHYKKALHIVEESFDANLRMCEGIFLGLGKAHLGLKNYDQALAFFSKVEDAVKGSETKDVQLELYRFLSRYYFEKGDYALYSEYNEKFLALDEQSEVEKNRITNKVLDLLLKQNKLLKIRVVAMYVLIVVILSVMALSFWRWRKIRMQNRLDTKSSEKNTEEKERASNKNGGQTKSGSLFSREMEIKIEKGLKKFESGEQFTDKNMSLSVLAGILEVNTKYLSYFLNSKRNKDFHSYINELRINYIIRKLESDAVYQNYKISYLADCCGFSSHSKFSAMFKNITGVTPSSYIDRLTTTSE